MVRNLFLLTFIYNVFIPLQANSAEFSGSLYFAVLQNFEVVYGYQLAVPEPDGTNFITCTNEKIKVERTLLREQPGSCKPGDDGGAFAGVIRSINPAQQTVTLTTYGGDQKTFEWSSDAPELAEFKPGDNVLFSSKDIQSAFPTVGDAHQIKELENALE